MRKRDSLLREYYPEVGAGGYTHLDGTIEFYGRIQALLHPNAYVLDYGAGRGVGIAEDPVPFRKTIRTLRGNCARVVGVDVDQAVLTNPGLDEAHIIELGRALPFADREFDLILSDWVFEHLEHPEPVTSELTRVLKPGGWICARTPNRWGYIGLATTAVPNELHSRVLRRLQPDRKERDVFPTAYVLNRKRDIDRFFPPAQFENYSYTFTSEPTYAGDRRTLWILLRLWGWLAPRSFQAVWMLFLKKKPA